MRLDESAASHRRYDVQVAAPTSQLVLGLGRESGRKAVVVIYSKLCTPMSRVYYIWNVSCSLGKC